jgi:protein involved in ribonucleotide reduction
LLIVYASNTGNVKRFVDRLEMRAININDIGSGIVDEPYVLITYTDRQGEIPRKVQDFLKSNRKNLVAVAASGNRNWGNNFAKSANSISYLYNVPILLKFELQGTNQDIETFRERVHMIDEVYRIKQ